jgi:nicotinate-nucleotide pyrophosphorylase (carboxylating)
MIDPYLLSALREDIPTEDITTNAVMATDCKGTAELYCKENGIIAGIDVFTRVFELLDAQAVCDTNIQDGDAVEAGALIGIIKADVKAILSGERTALNYLQRMSGVATLTKKYINLLEGSDTKLLDTRKTTPNMRIFEKYAVKVGGGTNHRFNLSDGILIKDNHIDAAGSIKNAVEAARAYAPFIRKVEVETETLGMVQEALDAKADIIMLDNMDIATMREAIHLINGRAITECSGNITEKRLEELAKIGLDYISCGALTHSATIVDFSLKHLKSVTS